MSLDERFYPEVGAGGFTRLDGNVEFYSRVNALLRPDMRVLDLGAGRGVAAEDTVAFRRQLATLKGKVAHVVGVDVDEAVKANPGLDEAIVYDGRVLPLGDESVDLILSDWVFEHIQDPEVFAREIERVLKPGGWLCARTPYLFSLLVVASSLVPNRHHSSVLKRVQPDRQEQDVFPAAYRLNTKTAVRRYFRPEKWLNHTYTWTPSPVYHFDNPVIYKLVQIYQTLKRPLSGDFLYIFLQKVG